ncbi:hypothetical protein ZTR_04908 [Talaromyces verruculosus]|nr:hypothetical protein ZTR_04908 [Talaromyces verruculosus]
MDSMNPRSNKLGQSVDKTTSLNLGRRVNSTEARRGQTNHQEIAMEHVMDSPESSSGRFPSTRSNDDHLHTLCPLEIYRTLFQADIAQTLATTQNDHLFVEQPFMADHAGNAYGNPGFVPQSGGYPYGENPVRRIQPLSTGDLFGLRAQAADYGHPPSGTTTAMSNPYSQDLHPGTYDTPASNGNVETTPELSTVLEGVTTGSSTSPVLPSNRGSQEPCMSVWNANPAGSNAPAGRNRKRRKMTEDELLRNRALKAAGGAALIKTISSFCQYQLRPQLRLQPQLQLRPQVRLQRFQRQRQLQFQVIVSRRQRTATSLYRAPACSVQGQGPTISTGMRLQSRSISIIIIINSNNNTIQGGASSNGTMSSAQSNANTFAIAYHPEMGVREQISLYTTGFGQQFNGQPAPEFDPVNAENALGTLEQWLHEHANSNRD